MLCHYFYNSISVCNLTDKHVPCGKWFIPTGGSLHICACLSLMTSWLSRRRAAQGGGRAAWTQLTALCGLGGLQRAVIALQATLAVPLLGWLLPSCFSEPSLGKGFFPRCP